MGRYDITLLGGDARIAYMLPCLLERGYSVICYGTQNLEPDKSGLAIYAENLKEAVEQADCIVGGIPLLKENKIFSKQAFTDLNQDNLYKYLKAGQIIFGGVISKEFIKSCTARKICCYDFMEDEALAVLNAIATAEGTILEALKNQNTNIHGSKSLVLGYGRCGRVLADKLKGMGADVTVCSSNEVELACADTFGLCTLPLNELEEKVFEYEYIYNTIPAAVLGRNILEQMRHDVLVLDIASGMGGVDYTAAEDLGISAVHCLGLPGKYAPRIAARQLTDFVSRILIKENHLPAGVV